MGKKNIYVSRVRWAFFEAAAEALNYSTMKAARMVYRGIPLFERGGDDNEFFLADVGIDDYLYLRQKGKREDITRSYELPDWATRYFVKTEHIKLHDAIFSSEWGLSPEELELRRSVLTSQLDTVPAARNIAWPWGSHETELLRKLASAAHEWWSSYDTEDSTTAPTNEHVANWLVSQGVAKRVAEVMAQILRADGLSSGPRK